MGEDERSCGSVEDRISGLPDELLHDILVRLGSAHAAACTSVLSRRWRHVCAHLPELCLAVPPEAAVSPASFMDMVDAALGGYLAPTLEHLSVSVSTNQLGFDLRVPSGRIAPWLQFAAEHVVGELYLYLFGRRSHEENGEELRDGRTLRPEGLREVVLLELPVCERAKEIEFFLGYERATWLRPQASGLFAALTSLRIGGNVRREGSDIAALVNTQCPCLRDLSLSIRLIAIFDVFIQSYSLHTMVLRVLETRRLEVVAPKLEEITVIIQPNEAHISAPKLVKVDWHDTYDPHVHRFVDVGRRLQLLRTSIRAFSLTKWLDEVDDFNLSISLKFPDVEWYESFLNETNKLPMCKSFCVFLSWQHHALVPIMLRLLRGCNGTKKFRVHLCGGRSRPVKHSCVASCPCRMEESRKIDGIDLSSLEVIEIRGFSGSNEQIEFVEFLSSNAGVLKRLLINDEFCRRPKEVCEKVRSMFHPNVKVEFSVLREGRFVD